MTRKILLVVAAMILSSCSSSLNYIQPRNKAAISLLEQMEKAYNDGDCNLYHELYEKFSAEKPSAKLRENAYLYDGICNERQGNADKAIAVYKLASGLYPKNPAFDYRLATIYLQTSFYEKSLPLFEKSISRNYQERDSLLGAARSNAALGRMPQAITNYTKALSMSGENNVLIIRELVECLVISQRYDEARKYIDKGYSIDRNPEWHVLAARSYAKEGNFAKASEEMSDAIIYDNKREYRISKAFYDYWAGNIRSAEAAADEELSANPYDYLAVFLKGMCLRSAGQKDIADSYFKISACGEKFIGDLSRKMSSVSLPAKEELCK